MRIRTQIRLIAGAILALTGAGPSAAQLHVEPAAIVVFPHVLVDGSREIDTVVQLGNVSNEPIEVRCYYEDLTPRCSGAGSCVVDPPSCAGECLPERAVTAFRLRMTGAQPFGWSVASGLRALPLDGRERVGPEGANNAGTHVPAVDADPFRGVLRCVAVDDHGRPVARNVLIGSASIETGGDAAQYQPVGFAARFETGPGDELLSLDVGSEYTPCPGSLALTHLYDGAAVPVGDIPATAGTDIALIPCNVDLGGTERA